MDRMEGRVPESFGNLFFWAPLFCPVSISSCDGFVDEQMNAKKGHARPAPEVWLLTGVTLRREGYHYLCRR